MSPEEINEYLLGKFKGKRSPDERELSEFSKQIYRKLDFQPMWDQVDLLFELSYYGDEGGK
tara:strand:- start:204 stop:386 length:183 start_codon:yes stop_codon:yes gene_type:complete